MKVLMPLPDRDFDVTESAVPWKVLTRAGHEVVFATELGESGPTPEADPLLFGGLPFGLGAQPDALACYREMAPALALPRRWSELDARDFDGLFLPGGHAPGMRQYLGAESVQALGRGFFAARKPVAAICHGVLVLARAGVLDGRRTTCLAKYQERSAYFLTAWKLGRYYRTYDAYVEDEVRAAGARFERGPVALQRRGSDADDGPAFVVEDGHYLSARWPGDAWAIAKRFANQLEAARSGKEAA